MVKDYVALDIETTGINPKEDRIIEIGMVKVKNFEIIETFESFVNPQCVIPEKVVELTGIKQEMINDAPVISQVIGGVIAFCEEFPILGHNIIFDYSFLKKAAVDNGLSFPKNGIDTLKLSRELLSELPRKNLVKICEYFGIDDGQEHRALYDARKSHEVYMLLWEKNQEYFREYLPKELIFNVKKDVPMTKRQNEYLKNLINYHKIETEVKIEGLTKSQASRMIDNILFNYGRIV